MELTPTQIKIIDNCLKKKGIKYWDLRIEMVDHIISDIEQHALTNNFKVELESSLKRIGWNGNLRNENISGWQNVNRKYRKEYGKGIVTFFKTPKNLLFIILFTVFYYSISKYFSFKTFKNIGGVLFILPIIPFLFIIIKQLFKRHGKSVNLDYGATYFSFAFLMMNFFIPFLKYLSEISQIILLLVFIPIYYAATYSGYKLYKKAISKVEKMKKQMAL